QNQPPDFANPFIIPQNAA
nr:RecName: Full=22 kDa cell wall protein [Phaseolus vulgaris]